MYLHPRGGERRGPMPLGLFLVFHFFGVTCPRPPIFARPNILVASFATQATACILSDHNIFYTPRGVGERQSNAPWSLAPDLRFSLGRTNTSCRRSVNISTIFSRLASIRQNLHEKRCRKLLAMQWHKTLFDESEDEDASKL